MNEQTKQRIEENRAKHVRPGSKLGWLSLASMAGKKIIDLEGYISQEFGLDSPVFNVCNVVFEDGTLLSLQGEHDTAYVPADDVPGLTKKDMLLCFDPGDIDEEDDEEDDEEYEAELDEED